MTNKVWTAIQLLTFVSFLPLCFTTKRAAGDRPDSPLDGFTAAADFIKLGLNPNADPCEDFWRFKCGNLANTIRSRQPNLTDYSHFTQLYTNFTRKLVKLLDELDPSDTPSLEGVASNVKVFWNKCLNRQTTPSKIASVRDAIEFTKEIGGAPLLDAEWKEPDESFSIHALEAQKRFGVEFGLNLFVIEDVEGKRNIIFIYLNTDVMDVVGDPSFVVQTQSVFAQLAGKSTVSEDKINQQQEEMQEAITELQKKVETLSGYQDEPVTITLKDVYELLPDFAKSLSKEGIGNASHIYIMQSHIDAIKAITPLLSRYSKYRRAMQNFLIGAYFNHVADHLDISDDTPLNITGEDASNLDESELGEEIAELPENTQYCLETAVTGSSKSKENGKIVHVLAAGYLEHAVLRLFVEKYGPSQTEALDMREIVDLIQEELRHKVFNAKWLDYPSKIRGLNKLTSIIPRVAYPMWIVNDTAVKDYFRNLGTFSDSDSYLKVLSKAQENNWKNYIDLLNRPIAQDYNNFGKSSFDLNAWYQPDRNAFALSLAIMQPPLYRPDYPKALIFGILGAITGHEIVHGFDKSGVEINLEGKLERWMSNESYEEFNNRSKCVEHQYANFCYNLSGTIECVDGEQTASENIADIEGLKAAYAAYKNYMEESGGSERGKTLPGLETYNWDQIFFMAYASAWCDMHKDFYIQMVIWQDEHSPHQSRVNGTMQNLPSFADAFNCPFGSKMNPIKKCHVW